MFFILTLLEIIDDFYADQEYELEADEDIVPEKKSEQAAEKVTDDVLDLGGDDYEDDEEDEEAIAEPDARRPNANGS